MSGHHNLEGKNGQIALKMLDDIRSVLDKHKIEFWLESGTLLGIVRENRLLPWDNDIDIAINEQSLDRLENILHEVSDMGYRVRTKQFEKNNPPFKKDVTRIVKIRNSRFFFFRGKVTLDIYIKFEKDGQYFYQCGNAKKGTNANFFENLDKIEFNSQIYNIPNEHEKYLSYKYGKWNIVNKGWNAFKDDNTIVGNV